jgi:hypothetical protein
MWDKREKSCTASRSESICLISETELYKPTVAVKHAITYWILTPNVDKLIAEYTKNFCV